ncbi:MAG: T9SS type A sorting domain-containing protein [Saprospiraceae bacterium]
MKKLNTLFVFLSLFSNISFAQTCLPNGIIFTTQSELDAFPNLYPNCTEITGNVKIKGTVNNLDSLIQITTIGGDLEIDSSEVEALTGLDNLISVGSDMSITDNSDLVFLNGLEGLISISGSFAIEKNPRLSSLNGLNNLQNVGATFYIGTTGTMIAGFEQFHDLTGLDGLTRVGEFYLSGMGNLTGLSGFENLDTIDTKFEIFNNNNLETLEGLEWMTHIPSEFRITGNHNLQSFKGLENLEIIEGDFLFAGNDSLDDVTAMSNLHTIEGSMTLISLLTLSSLEGFSNLVNVEKIELQFVSALTSLSGLENINTTNLIELVLFENPMLAFCNQPNICDFILNGGNATLINNAFGCNDIMLIAEICNPSGSTCSFGNVALTNQDEVDNFPSLYPNCTEVLGNFTIEGEISNLDSLEQLTSVLGALRVSDCDSLMSLNGLHNINSVGSLWISGHLNLKNLNGLESLDEIADGILIGGNDSLITLNGIGTIINIGTLTIDTNPNLEDISSLSSLASIDGNLEVRSCHSLITLLGLQNITSVSSSIFIDDNAILENIQAIENIDLGLLSGGFSLSFNPFLETCNYFNICNHLNNMGGISINNNATGCDSEQEVETACANNFSKVNHFFFYDLNQNKIKDIDEVFIADLPLNVSPINLNSYSNAINGGAVYIEQQGEYILTFDTLMYQDWQLITDSVSYHLSIDSPNFCDTIYFGLYPSVERSYMVSLINGPPARCGEFKTFEVSAKNLGTTVTSGTIWLEVDNLIAQTNYIDIPDTINANIYGWHFENLFPGFTETKQISLEIPIPPNVVLGDSLSFSSYVDYEDVNGMTTTNTFNYITEIRCSFDPNDKLVNPSRNNNFTLFEEDLVYTIRFQNTGNDEAYDIIIRDTLDDNLDPITFRMLSTSHPNSLITSMEADQFLTFNFENIYLPDSTTNFDASQGYVSYLIAPKEGLAEETLIENTASIYFDFNPPIVTNTTENVMVSELPTSIHHLGGTTRMKIEIFPNPVSDNIFIKKEKYETLEYQITDVNGRILMNGELIDEIHNITFTRINSGIYFMKITNPATGEYIVEKLIKL